jgi:hypothetical protein
MWRGQQWVRLVECRESVVCRTGPPQQPRTTLRRSLLQDERMSCTSAGDHDELATSCGAKAERWASDVDAKARAADISKKLKDRGLGAECDYVRDTLVLRVAGGTSRRRRPSSTSRPSSARSSAARAHHGYNGLAISRRRTRARESDRERQGHGRV